MLIIDPFFSHEHDTIGRFNTKMCPTFPFGSRNECLCILAEFWEQGLMSTEFNLVKKSIICFLGCRVQFNAFISPKWLLYGSKWPALLFNNSHQTHNILSSSGILCVTYWKYYLEIHRKYPSRNINSQIGHIKSFCRPLINQDTMSPFMTSQSYREVELNAWIHFSISNQFWLWKYRLWQYIW